MKAEELDNYSPLEHQTPQGRQSVKHKSSNPQGSPHKHCHLLSIWDFYPNSKKNKQA